MRAFGNRVTRELERQSGEVHVESGVEVGQCKELPHGGHEFSLGNEGGKRDAGGLRVEARHTGVYSWDRKEPQSFMSRAMM